jgi:hypothetical protein
MYKSCDQYFNSKTILNKKTFNHKLLDIVEHYDFDIGHLSIQPHLENSKNWNLRNL